MNSFEKPLLILHGGIRTPPFSEEARRKVGFLLRMLQKNHQLSMPVSRPMPSIGRACHELRITDPKTNISWRILYRLDPKSVIIIDIFKKKTQETPKSVLEKAKRRLREYDVEKGRL